MYLLGALFGGFVGYGILSRLILWIVGKIVPAHRLWLGHLISFALAYVIVGFGAANSGPFVWTAGLLYIIPTLLWAIIDITIDIRKRDQLSPSNTTGAETNSPD